MRYASSGQEQVILSGSNDSEVLLGLKDALGRFKTEYISQIGSVLIQG